MRDHSRIPSFTLVNYVFILSFRNVKIRHKRLPRLFVGIAAELPIIVKVYTPHAKLNADFLRFLQRLPPWHSMPVQ